MTPSTGCSCGLLAETSPASVRGPLSPGERKTGRFLSHSVSPLRSQPIQSWHNPALSQSTIMSRRSARGEQSHLAQSVESDFRQAFTHLAIHRPEVFQRFKHSLEAQQSSTVNPRTVPASQHSIISTQLRVSKRTSRIKASHAELQNRMNKGLHCPEADRNSASRRHLPSHSEAWLGESCLGHKFLPAHRHWRLQLDGRCKGLGFRGGGAVSTSQCARAGGAEN